MHSIKVKALLLIFLSLVEAGTGSDKGHRLVNKPVHKGGSGGERSRALSLNGPEGAPDRQLIYGQVGIALAGFLSGYLLAKYYGSKSPVHWKDDKVWEQRFLQISQNDSLTLKFMNLILDSYALDLSNACLRTYYKNFHDKVKYADSLSVDDNAKNEIKSAAWNVLNTNVGYCSDFFKFVVSHGFITKYMMNANYAIFYFAESFMGGIREDSKDLIQFLKEQQTEIFSNPLYQKIDEAHQNYFYITVNYLLDSENKLKKIQQRVL